MSKPHQTAKHHANDKTQLKARVGHSLGSKDAKSSILWSISLDQLNQSEANPRSAVTNYRKCMRSKSVSRVRHAASNTEDGLSVVTSKNPPVGIAHFQKEWKPGTRMGARLVMGSFGGARV